VNVAPHVLDDETFLRHQPDVDATVIVPIDQHGTCVGFLPLLAWELAVDPIDYVVRERFEHYPVFGLDYSQNIGVDITYDATRVVHSDLIHRGGL
jgi:hypothetical protein